MAAPPKKSKIDELSNCSANLDDAEDCRARELQPDEEELAEIAMKREEAGKLHSLIAKTQCEICGIKGCFDVTRTDGKIRHIKCRGCSNSTKIMTE